MAMKTSGAVLVCQRMLNADGTIDLKLPDGIDKNDIEEDSTYR